VLTQVLAADADLARGYELLQQSRAVIRTRELTARDAWLTEAQVSALAPFVSLANGIQQDRAAFVPTYLIRPRPTRTAGSSHRTGGA
jgi:hypothetical protein